MGSETSQQAFTLQNYSSENPYKKLSYLEPSKRNDFYYFTSWLINFKFYRNMLNEEPVTNIITVLQDPRETIIFEIIREIDQLKEKDYRDFHLATMTEKEYQQFRENELRKLNSDDSKLSNNENDESLLLKNKENDEKMFDRIEGFQFDRDNRPLKGNRKQKDILPKISESDLYMEFLQFLSILCYQKFKTIQKFLLKGPPNNLRWILYMTLINSKYVPSVENPDLIYDHSNIYEGISNELKVVRNENNMTFSEKFAMITKKVAEIGEKIYQFNPTKHKKKYRDRIYKRCETLKSLLQKFFIYDRHIDYESDAIYILCMNILILSDFNEEQAFLYLRYVTSEFYGLGLREFFFKKSTKLKYICFVIYKFTEREEEEIFEKISSFNLDPSQWIEPVVTGLFSQVLNLSITVRLYDFLLVLGVKFVINYFLGVLAYFKREILGCQNKEEFLDFFVGKLREKIKNFGVKQVEKMREELIKEALNYNLTQDKLNSITYLFNSTVIKDKQKEPQIVLDFSPHQERLFCNYNISKNIRKVFDTTSMDFKTVSSYNKTMFVLPGEEENFELNIIKRFGKYSYKKGGREETKDIVNNFSFPHKSKASLQDADSKNPIDNFLLNLKRQQENIKIEVNSNKEKKQVLTRKRKLPSEGKSLNEESESETSEQIIPQTAQKIDRSKLPTETLEKAPTFAMIQNQGKSGKMDSKSSLNNKDDAKNMNNENMGDFTSNNSIFKKQSVASIKYNNSDFNFTVGEEQFARNFE